jgi:hypothetical protein
MEISSTPRQMIKGLLNGAAPLRPLLLPIVFSLGAKVENIPFATFLENPTKISNSLRQIRSHLRPDGVACYFDPYLEVEALGATLQTRADGETPAVGWPQSAAPGELPQGLRSPEEAVQCGRVPVAVEVLRRMNAVPNRDFLLMAGVTGPLTLAARICGADQTQNLGCEGLPSPVLEHAAAVVTQMATTFLNAGADSIVIHEELLPAFSLESFEAWASLLAPTLNIVRFYEALPVLLLSNAGSVPQNWDQVLLRQWECAVCLPIEALRSREERKYSARNGMALGISLPLETFRQEGSSCEEIVAMVRRANTQLRPSIIMTAGDVPFETDLKRLTAILAEVPRAF